MNIVVAYIAKNIVVSGVLVAFYWLVLRNRKMHMHNRFFLLFAMAGGIMLPFCRFNWFTMPTAPAEHISAGTFLLHAMNDNSAPLTGSALHSSHIDVAFVYAAVYGLITTMLMGLILYRAVSTLRLANKYPKTDINGVPIHITDLPQSPFSFFNCIFWRSSIPIDTENSRMILRHELVHIKQKHSFDKIAVQLLAAIFWINPFYWIIGRELSMVHEYIADDLSVPQHDTAAFARMLLQAHNGGALLVPEHQFFSSPIKRRLIMLQTTKTRYTALRALLVLPVVAGLIVLFSFTNRKQPVTPAAKKIVLVVDAGHGGTDLGASYGPYVEKDINLRIAKRLMALSSDYNIETHLTRSEDDDHTLAQRVEYSGQIHPDAFVSIHVNDAKANSNKGNFDVIISMDNSLKDKSQALGWAVYQQMQHVGYALKKDHLTNERIYVCAHNSAPAILLELGDIKQADDMAMLADQAKLDNVCNAILRGIVASNKN